MWRTFESSIVMSKCRGRTLAQLCDHVLALEVARITAMEVDFAESQTLTVPEKVENESHLR
jgi:hypothetical protein